MTASTTAGAAHALAQWAVAFEPTQDDLALADRSLTDTVAVALAARTHPIRRVTTGLSEVAQWAVASHVLDFDDLHMESTTHISTVCVPVALAEGGGPHAYLAGAGVMARLGQWLGWEHYSAGWHATTTTGALAAAATAAAARGFDEDRTARALALSQEGLLCVRLTETAVFRVALLGWHRCLVLPIGLCTESTGLHGLRRVGARRFRHRRVVGVVGRLARLVRHCSSEVRGPTRLRDRPRSCQGQRRGGGGGGGPVHGPDGGHD